LSKIWQMKNIEILVEHSTLSPETHEIFLEIWQEFYKFQIKLHKFLRKKNEFSATLFYCNAALNFFK
jgi:hypothetical protein